MKIPGWGSVGFRGMRMSELPWSGIACRGLHVDTVGKLPTTSLQEEETVRTSAVFRKDEYWREFINNLPILSIFYPFLLFFRVSWPGWKIAFNLSSCPKLGNNLRHNLKYKSNTHEVQLFKVVLAFFCSKRLKKISLNPFCHLQQPLTFVNPNHQHLFIKTALCVVLCN